MSLAAAHTHRGACATWCTQCSTQSRQARSPASHTTAIFYYRDVQVSTVYNGLCFDRWISRVEDNLSGSLGTGPQHTTNRASQLN
jgi:hypothetical protein